MIRGDRLAPEQPEQPGRDRPEDGRAEEEEEQGDDPQRKPPRPVGIEIGMDDQEPGCDRERGRGRDRQFIDDRGGDHAAGNPGPLGQQDPCNDEQDGPGYVSDQHRLGVGPLGFAGPDPTTHPGEDQAPGRPGQDEVDAQHRDRRDQPEHLERDSGAFDLRPLGDDGRDQEAEDQQGEKRPQGEANGAPPRGTAPESGRNRADPFEEGRLPDLPGGLGSIGHRNGHILREQ